MGKDLNKEQLERKRTLHKLQNHLSHVASLLMVFLLLMATATWMGSLFGTKLGVTKGTALKSRALDQPTAQQLQQMGLDEEKVELTEMDSASWMVETKEGKQLGTIVTSAPYATEVKGFAGPTPLYVYLDKQGTIKQIVAQDNAETPDFFKKAFSTLVPQWIGTKSKEAASKDVDAVTGATFSSHAIIENVKASMAAYAASKTKRDIAEPTIGWGRTLAVCFVLLMGILIRSFFRGNKRLRVLQLLLNVVVLGFWCGQFLSLSLLRGWIANGLNIMAYLPTVLVLAVAVILPFFKQKHHYCSWICPLGSLQELAAYMPVPKIHCSPEVYRRMSRVRMWAFAILMLALWTGIGGIILDYEPFTTFLWQTAAPVVMCLAAVIVVASMFVSNVWCKSLCPMGMLLDISEK